MTFQELSDKTGEICDLVAPFFILLIMISFVLILVAVGFFTIKCGVLSDDPCCNCVQEEVKQ